MKHKEASETKRKQKIKTKHRNKYPDNCSLRARLMNIHAKSQSKCKMFSLGDSQLVQHTMKKVAVYKLKQASLI